MKKIILFFILFVTILLLLFFFITAYAADLVCDPDQDHVKYEIEGLAADIVTVDAIEHALKYNLDTIPPGDYSITVRAINAWEEKSDDSAPFSFRRPAKSPAQNIKVVYP